jgi:hypothetical protein
MKNKVQAVSRNSLMFEITVQTESHKFSMQMNKLNLEMQDGVARA